MTIKSRKQIFYQELMRARNLIKNHNEVQNMNAVVQIKMLIKNAWTNNDDANYETVYRMPPNLEVSVLSKQPP